MSIFNSLVNLLGEYWAFCGYMHLLAANPSHLACFITLYLQWETTNKTMVVVIQMIPNIIQIKVSIHSALIGVGVKHISLCCWPYISKQDFNKPIYVRPEKKTEKLIQPCVWQNHAFITHKEWMFTHVKNNFIFNTCSRISLRYTFSLTNPYLIKDIYSNRLRGYCLYMFRTCSNTKFLKNENKPLYSTHKTRFVFVW